MLRQDEILQKIQRKNHYSLHYRDEIKRDKALEEKRSKIMSNARNLAKASLEEPSLWGSQNLIILHISLKHRLMILPNFQRTLVH